MAITKFDTRAEYEQKFQCFIEEYSLTKQEEALFALGLAVRLIESLSKKEVMKKFANYAIKDWDFYNNLYQEINRDRINYNVRVKWSEFLLSKVMFNEDISFKKNQNRLNAKFYFGYNNYNLILEKENKNEQ